MTFVSVPHVTPERSHLSPSSCHQTRSWRKTRLPMPNRLSHRQDKLRQKNPDNGIGP